MADIDSILATWGVTNKPFNSDLKDQKFGREVFYSIKALNKIIPLITEEYREKMGDLPTGQTLVDLIENSNKINKVTLDGIELPIEDKTISLPESFYAKKALTTGVDLNSILDTGYYTANGIKMINFLKGNELSSYFEGILYVFNCGNITIQQVQGVYNDLSVIYYRVIDNVGKTFYDWVRLLDDRFLRYTTLKDYVSELEVYDYGIGTSIITSVPDLRNRKEIADMTFGDIKPAGYVNPYE